MVTVDQSYTSAWRNFSPFLGTEQLWDVGEFPQMNCFNCFLNIWKKENCPHIRLEWQATYEQKVDLRRCSCTDSISELVSLVLEVWTRWQLTPLTLLTLTINAGKIQYGCLYRKQQTFKYDQCRSCAINVLNYRTLMR